MIGRCNAGPLMGAMAAMAVSTVLVGACTFPVTSPSASIPMDATEKIVNVEGASYRLSPLTASTWTASAVAEKPVVNSTSGKATLIDAIEKNSGCKVTDTDISRQGLQLDAQVDCSAQLKN
jgi:hypothetical protein